MNGDEPTTRNLLHQYSSEGRLMDRVLIERIDKLERIVGDNHQAHEAGLNQLRVGQLESQRSINALKDQLSKNTELLEPIRALLSLKKVIIGFSALVAAIAGLITALRVWVPT